MKKITIFLLILSLFTFVIDSDRYILVCAQELTQSCEAMMTDCPKTSSPSTSQCGSLAEQPEPTVSPCASKCGNSTPEPEPSPCATRCGEQPAAEVAECSIVDYYNSGCTVLELKECIKKCCPGRFSIPEQVATFKESQQILPKDNIILYPNKFCTTSLQAPPELHKIGPILSPLHPTITITVLLC